MKSCIRNTFNVTHFESICKCLGGNCPRTVLLHLNIQATGRTVNSDQHRSENLVGKKNATLLGYV